MQPSFRGAETPESTYISTPLTVQIDNRVLLLAEQDLRQVLKEYSVYFNRVRPHQGIEQRIPVPQELTEPLSGGDEQVVAFPVLGGLHHDYRRAA